MSLLAWLRARDPNLLNLRKSARAMLVAAPLFALLKGVLDLGPIATFGFFGCFVGLVFANFGGPTRPRAMAYVAMIAICDIVIVIGSLLSEATVGGAIAMFVIVFLVSFATVLGGYAPSFMAPVALSFSLAVLDPLSAASIDDRIIGWTIGGIAAMVAALVLWPIDRRPVLRRGLADVCGGVAAALASTDNRAAAQAGYQRALDALMEVTRKASSPLRPAGPTSRDIGLLHLIGLMEQAVTMTRRYLDGPGVRGLDTPLASTSADAFRRSRAVLLEEIGPESVAQNVPELDEARLATDRAIDLAAIQAAQSPTADIGEPDQALAEVRHMFPIKALSHIAIWVEVNAARALGASSLVTSARTAPELRRLSDRPTALLSRFGQVVSGGLDRDGVILRNSIRAAAAMSLAVVVAKLVPVDHGFWITLAALLVLHSSAASTTATSLQAVAGTAAGFVVAAAILMLFGNDEVALWVLLPFAVFFAGYLTGVIGLLAGQAAFTTLVVVLFTLIDPSGITTDIVRVETVALGAACGAVMAFVLWPHGARVALARSVETAYRTAGEAVQTVLTAPAERRVKAGFDMRTARRRADEAFTVALTERGARIDIQAWMTLFRAPNMVHSLVVGYSPPQSPWLTDHGAAALAATIDHRDQVADALRHVADRLDPTTADLDERQSAKQRLDLAPILADCINRARLHGPDKVDDVRLLIMLNEWLSYVAEYVDAAEPELDHVAFASKPGAWLRWSLPGRRTTPVT